MAIERLLCVIKKEFIQIFRNSKMRAIVLVMPLLQSMVFGYAVTTDVNHVNTAVYDQAQTPESRDLIDRFIHSGYFSIKKVIRSDQEMDEVIDRGEVSAILRFPPDFSGKLAAGKWTILCPGIVSPAYYARANTATVRITKTFFGT